MEVEIEVSTIVSLIILAGIVYLAAYVRSGPLNSPTLLDYDPHWHGRHAQMILENGLMRPEWDAYSFFPPGRPFPYQLGWEYVLIFIYFILNFTIKANFLGSLMLSNLIVAGATAIVAFILGRKLTNKWGGLAAAIFLTLTPAYIGVTQAGYIDSDGIVVFFMVTVALAISNALEKRTKLSIALACLTMFIWTFFWQASWFIFLIFAIFIPFYFLFLTIKENLYKKAPEIESPNTDGMDKKHRRKAMKEYRRKLEGLKPDKKFIIPFGKMKDILVVLSVIFIVVTVLNVLPTNTITIWESMAESLGFVEKKMIVNVSVAELQPIGNIFSWGGLNSIFNRVGYSLYLAFFIIPFVIYKLFKKEKISISLVFCMFWLLVAFLMLTWGWRFALLFSIPCALCAGVVVGEVVKYSMDMKYVYASVLVGAMLIIACLPIESSLEFGKKLGYDISPQWLWGLDYLRKDAKATNKSLVMTWWDPGHIIANLAEMKTHADGAHCNDYWCYPWGHNTRIQDMGKIMSTQNETEAVEIIKKYVSLTEEQKQEVGERFGYDVPPEAFEEVDKVFFISSSDLVYKFVWMNYFGYYGQHSTQPELLDETIFKPGQCLAGETGEWVWCPWVMSSPSQIGEDMIVYDYSGLKFTLVQRNETIVPVFQNQYIVDYMSFVTSREGYPQYEISSYRDYEPNQKHLDGLFFVSEDFQTLIYVPGEIKESIFIKTFLFNGEGLNKFNLIFWNDQIKIYEVELD